MMSAVPAQGALAAQGQENHGLLPHSNSSSQPAVVTRPPVNLEIQAVSAPPAGSDQPSAANATLLRAGGPLQAPAHLQQQGAPLQQPQVPSGTNSAATAACTELAVEPSATGAPHHATAESLGLSTTAATASSSIETASSGTHTPSSPPAAGHCEGSGAAIQAPNADDGNKPATASSDFVSSNAQPPIVLTPSIHSFDCECGELSLRNDEVQLLQPFLLQRCWRLVPCPVPARKGGSKSSRSRVRPSRRIAQELEALQSVCDSTAFELGRRRQKRASTRYDDIGDDRKSSRARGGSPGVDPSVASVKSADASVVSQARTRSRTARNCGMPDAAAAYPGMEARSSRRRRYMNGDDTQSLNSDVWGEGEAASAVGSSGKPRRILASTRWRDSCMAILQHLKSLKAAQWFLYPVDPEADNVPDYFDVVQHPMDLQTVEKKLLQGAYHHPFLWQQDVRQVFFNAFSYHVMSNDVWKDATALALEFERCCKQVDEVNPYAEVVSDSDELAASLQTTRPLDSLQLAAPQVSVEETWAHQQLPETAVKDRRAPPLPSMDSTCTSALHHQPYQEEQPHLYHAGSMAGGGRTRNRTRRTQRQPMDADDGMYEEYSLGRSCSKKLTAANSSPRRGGRGRGRGIRGSGMVGRQGPWDGGASGPVPPQSGYGVAESFQLFEPPVDGVVLPPPPVPRIGVNDKPLSSSQRRTLEHHMTMLSPEQRRAALELIQDDLGILAADHMCDSTFSFDTELLSIEKQKRLFAYVNSMVRANRELLMSRGLLGNPAAEAQAAPHPQNAGDAGADGRNGPRDGGASARHDSDSSSSDSDSSTSSSSDSLSSSTSSSDSDSDDGDRPRPSGNTHQAPTGGMAPGNSSGGSAPGFDGGCRAAAATGDGGTTVQKGLPEYRPVAEDGEKVQIREELMGRHADFLGVIDAQQADDSMVRFSDSVFCLCIVI